MNIREASKQKTEEIIRYVNGRVSGGEWPQGHRLPTEKEISQQFKAARNTVRKALGTLEREGTIVRQVRARDIRRPGKPIGRAATVGRGRKSGGHK